MSGRRAQPWSYGSAFGGVTIDHNGDQVAMIAVDGRCAYSTAVKKARRMIKLLNAGERELAREAEIAAMEDEPCPACEAEIAAMEDEPCPACEDTGTVTSIHCDTIGLRCGCGIDPKSAARRAAESMKPEIEALHAHAERVVEDRNRLIDTITDPAVRRSLGRD